MPQKSYLTERLEQLGLEESDIKFPYVSSKQEADRITYEFNENDFHTLFTEQTDKEGNATGNISIHYLTEYGAKYQYFPPGNKTQRPFIRTRLANPQEDQPKYLSPKGAPLAPFFPPKIIQAYCNEEKIETLIVTEGEFKAIKGDHHDLYVIGLPGIQGFYGERPGQIHHSISNVIRRCKVENVIYLTDADTFTLTWKKDKDLAKRPKSFHSAVQNFRESLEYLLADPNFDLQRIHFYSISRRFDKEGAKGLDDLMVAYPAKISDIIKDLTQTQGNPSEFFDGSNLTAWNTVSKKLYKDFGLNKAEDFYNLYKEFIGDREFIFNNVRYQWDGDKLAFQRHADSELYCRVGTDWFKEVETPVPGMKGTFVKNIQKWTKGALLEDYRNYKDFIDQLPRFDAFTAEPNWNGKYRRRVGQLYNLMNPMEHKPKEGGIKKTLKFLKHIFGGEATVDNPIIGDPFTVAMDWLTLIYREPMQMLPVPILVSEENGTGKSSFLKWLKMIYTSNAVIMNNQQFAMNFNAHYASKFLIMIDEGFLEVEKKAEKERIKQLATSDEIQVQFKGADLKPIPYYGKLVICSNDADRVMKIEEGESRWFVVKVPVIPKKDKDPEMLDKMAKEIPAFLHFLTHREIAHPKEDRLWFDPERFITDQFTKIVENTRNRLDKVIEAFIKETFLTFKQSPLQIPNKQLVQEINKTAKYKMDETDLREFLRKRGMKTNKNGSVRYRFPVAWEKDFQQNQMEIRYLESVGRCYEFHAADWLDEGELKEFNEPLKFEFRDEHGEPKKPSQMELEIANAQGENVEW